MQAKALVPGRRALLAAAAAVALGASMAASGRRPRLAWLPRARSG